MDFERLIPIDGYRAGERLTATRPPRVVGVGACGDAGDVEGAPIVGDGEVWRLDRQDVRRHVRMNVAEHARQAGLVEDDALRGAFRIHPEVELLPVAE